MLPFGAPKARLLPAANLGPSRPPIIRVEQQLPKWTASSVADMGVTTLPVARKLPPMIQQLPARSMDVTSSPSRAKPPFVASGIYEAPQPHAPMAIAEPMYVPSVAVQITSPSPGPVSPNRETNKGPYFDFSPFIIPRTTPINYPCHYANIYNKITTPYNADAFTFFLKKHRLFDQYRLLPRNLTSGFPTAAFPVLSHRVIFPPHPTTGADDLQILDYVHDEARAGRMDGPFESKEVQLILKGPFQCSPLILQEQGDKIRICRHLLKHDRSHPSVNSFVAKDNFPTAFASTSEIAEILCSISFLLHISLRTTFLYHASPCTTSWCLPSKHTIRGVVFVHIPPRGGIVYSSVWRVRFIGIYIICYRCSYILLIQYISGCLCPPRLRGNDT